MKFLIFSMVWELCFVLVEALGFVLVTEFVVSLLTVLKKIVSK